MVWKVDFSDDAVADLDRLYDHLARSYLEQGLSTWEAVNRAENRIETVVRQTRKLALAPFRGTFHADMRGYRHTTMDSAILSVSEKNCIACSLPLPTVEREQR